MSFVAIIHSLAFSIRIYLLQLSSINDLFGRRINHDLLVRFGSKIIVYCAVGLLSLSKCVLMLILFMETNFVGYRRYGKEFRIVSSLNQSYLYFLIVSQLRVWMNLGLLTLAFYWSLLLSQTFFVSSFIILTRTLNWYY